MSIFDPGTKIEELLTTLSACLLGGLHSDVRLFWEITKDKIDIYTGTRLYDDDWSPSRISLQPFIIYLGFLFPSPFTPITLTSSYLLYLTSTWPKFYLSTI